MKKAILWKELREQMPIQIALLVLGAAIITGVTALVGVTATKGPQDLKALTESPRLVLLMLICAGGMVVGGTLFAGEHEAGTFAFLRSTPTTMQRLWWAKVLAGLLIAFVITVLFVIVGAAVGIYEGAHPLTWPLWLILCGLAAFCAGTAGSVVSKSGLVACGLGGIGAVAWSIVGSILLAIIHAIFVNKEPQSESVDAATMAIITLPAFIGPVTLLQSFWVFTRPDRLRKLVSHGPTGLHIVAEKAGRFPLPRSVFGFRQLVWLVRRQLFWPTLYTFLLALIPAGVMCVKDVSPLVLWPTALFFFSAVLAVVAFSDEQARGANRYWSERQLPAGRVWLVKVLAVFAISLALGIWLMIPNAIVNGKANRMYLLFRSGLVQELGLKFILFLLTPPVYGVCFGIASALLFRKTIVAIGVAVLVGGTMAVLWVPSMVSGGLHYWQVLAPPFIVLIFSRLMTRAWVNEQLASPLGLAKIATGATLAVAMTAYGLVYRVIEIPVMDTSEDDIAFSKTIPTYDEKQPGRELRAAASRYNDRMRTLEERKGKSVVVGKYFYPSEFKQIGSACEIGWNDDDANVNAWLDRMFEGDWLVPLDRMRDRPPGVFVDPNEKVDLYELQPIQSIFFMSSVLSARGLQLQKRGDHASYVDMLDRALTTTRTIRHKTFSFTVRSGLSQELNPQRSIPYWLEELPGRPDLLRKAAKVLEYHEKYCEVNLQDIVYANVVRARLAYSSPQFWYSDLKDTQERPNGQPESGNEKHEAEFLGFAWTVPWEKERLRRAVGLYNSQEGRLIVYDFTLGLPGNLVFTRDLFNHTESIVTRNLEMLSRTRLARVCVAVRLFEEEMGRPPENLNELVPKYLGSIPLDPYDGNPLRHRVSPGEILFQPMIDKPEDDLQLRFQGIDREILTAVATVAGGTVLRTEPPQAMFPPGQDQTTMLEDEQFDAIAAIASVNVRWPLFISDDLNFPPGVGFGEPGREQMPVTLSEMEYTAASAVVGSVVQVDLDPIVRIDTDGRVVRADAMNWSLYKPKTIAPGTPIVWSIGPDKTDNDAIIPMKGTAANNTGDMVYIVPRKPSSSTGGGKR